MKLLFSLHHFIKYVMVFQIYRQKWAIMFEIGKNINTFGEPPYLYCDCRAERRLSAFYATLKSYDNQCIYQIYQPYKKFINGSENYAVENRNDTPITNEKEILVLYTRLWKLYFDENPELVRILVASKGLTDGYGKSHGICQSEVLWNIRSRFLDIDVEKWIINRRSKL